MSKREDFLNSAGELESIETSTGIYGLFGKYRPFSNFHMEAVTVDENLKKSNKFTVE